MHIGLREANQRFSRVIRAVRSGRKVVLTERGQPIAIVAPVRESGRGEALLRRLEAAGLIRRASKRKPMPPWRSRPVKGVPLSRTIREERDLS